MNNSLLVTDDDLGRILVPEVFPSKFDLRDQAIKAAECSLEHASKLDAYIAVKGMEHAVKDMVGYLKEGAIGDFLGFAGGSTKEMYKGVKVSLRKTGVDSAVWEYPQEVLDVENKLTQIKLELERWKELEKAYSDTLDSMRDLAKMNKTAKLIKPPPPGYGNNIVIEFT